jgi:hypothetical protein
MALSSRQQVFQRQKVMDKTLQTFIQLYQLQTAYWYDVDHNGGDRAASFFVEDGVFTIGDQIMKGTAEISAFYRWRRGLGVRLARHVISNASVSSVTARSATFKCIMQLFAANGSAVLESRPAILITDIIDDCIFENGSWYFKSHELIPLFASNTPATIPSRKEIEDNK